MGRHIAAETKAMTRGRLFRIAVCLLTVFFAVPELADSRDADGTTTATAAIEAADNVCLAATTDVFVFHWKRSDWRARLDGLLWKVWIGDEWAPKLVVFVPRIAGMPSGCYVEYVAYRDMTHR